MTHEDSATRITDLVMGRLAAAEADAVRRHLAGCGDCRELESTYRSIAEAHATVDADHPSTETLVDFAMGRQSLEREQRLAVAAHVKRCAPCLAEVDAVRTVEADAVLSRSAVDFEHGSARVPARRRFGLLAAGLLLALLGYPALLGLRHLVLGPAPAGTAGDESPVGLVHVTLLYGPQRGSEATAQVVELDETSPSLILAVEPSALLGLPDDATVRFDIRGPRGAPVYDESFAMGRLRQHFNRSGVVALLTPAERLATGRHVLRVWVEGIPDGQLLLEKPFDVARPRGDQRQSPSDTKGPQ